MSRGFHMGGAGGSTPEIEALIPAMTSDTTPSGICTASSLYNSSYPAWHGFDGVTIPTVSTPWNSRTGESHSFLAYAFPMPVVAKNITYVNVADAAGAGIIGIKIQASNDGANWTDLTNEITLDCRGARQSGTISIPNNKAAFSNYRLYLSTGTNGLTCLEMQIYGY